MDLTNVVRGVHTMGFRYTINCALVAVFCISISICGPAHGQQSQDAGLRKIPAPGPALDLPDENMDRGGTGACCLQTTCYDPQNSSMTEELCLIFGGVWNPGVDCASGVCDDENGGPCSAGFILDCAGNCAPIGWLGDGFCDDGTYDFNGVPIYFNCAEHGCDAGDCDDSVCDLPTWEGACCTDSGCQLLSYVDCLAIAGTYMGEYTQCNSQTCSCPPFFIPDCSGSCIPIYLLGDGQCQHGEFIDEYTYIGDPGIDVFNMLCPELACDSGDCIGGGCIGACCVNGTCLDGLTFDQCIDQGGTYRGALIQCQEISCDDSVRALLPTEYTLTIPNQGNSGNGLDDEGGIGFSCASHGNMMVVGHSDVQSASGNAHRLVAHIYHDGNQIATQTIYPPDIDINIAGRAVAVDTDGSSIVIAGGNYAVVYIESNGAWVEEEIIVADGVGFSSAAISGDYLYLGHPASNQVLVLTRSGGSWTEVTSIVSSTEDFSFGTTLSADANTLVVTDQDTVYAYDTATLTLQFTHPIYGQHDYRPRFALALGPLNDVEVDGDYFIVGDAGPADGSGFGHMFKKTGGAWASHQLLTPTVAGGRSIKTGYAVALHDGLAIVTAPQASEIEVQSGGAYLFGDIDGEWIEIARILDPSSVVNEGLGVSAAIGDQIWLGCSQTLYKLWGADVYESMQVATLPEHLWINESVGDVDVASNWFPDLPTAGSTATLSIQTRYTVTCSDGSLPFDNMDVGPGNPILDLSGTSSSLSGQIDVAGIGSMYSTLELLDGTLTAQGPVTIGGVLGTNTPGTIDLIGDAQIRALNSYVQNDLGTLSCQLNNSGKTPLVVEGDLVINGVLKITTDDDFVPPDGRSSITLVHSENAPSEGSDRFKLSIMPGRSDGKFYKLSYGDLGRGAYTIDITTETLPVDGSLSSPDEIGVTGQATDVLVQDLFSPDGGLDGFADIALTIDGSPGQLYLFVNDGAGGISLQTTYPTGNGPTAITSGDMDHDGIDDIIVTNGLDDTFQYWLNPDGDAATLVAESPITTGSMPSDIIAFDIDSDIDDDIVITCAGSGTPDPVTGEFYGVVQFFESDGTRGRALTSKQDLIVNKQPRGISPGEVDNPGDKQDDIIVTLSSGNQVVRLGNPGSGADWTIDQTVDVGDRPKDIEPLPIGGSIGTVFLVGNEGSNSMSVLASNAQGSLEVIASVDLQATPLDMTTVDMDGDSDRDLVILVNNELGNDIRVYRNDTDVLSNVGIALTLDDVLLDDGLPVLVSNGDTNNDGVDDLVSITGSSPGLRGGLETLSVRRGEQSVCAGDIDGDGTVNVIDLLSVISAWGSCDGCDQDTNGDGAVNVIDLLAIISAWGDCT